MITIDTWLRHNKNRINLSSLCIYRDLINIFRSNMYFISFFVYFWGHLRVTYWNKNNNTCDASICDNGELAHAWERERARWKARVSMNEPVVGDHVSRGGKKGSVVSARLTWQSNEISEVSRACAWSLRRASERCRGLIAQRRLVSNTWRRRSSAAWTGAVGAHFFQNR